MVVCLATSRVAEAAPEGRSRAAEYLVREELASACEQGGRIDPSAVIERDLTGDGRSDLIVSHEGIACEDQGRSLACGMQVCAVMIYVRRGELLQPEVTDLMGMMVTVGEGSVPEIRWHGPGGAGHSMRWDGQSFR
jgi:hypothetical protein